MFAAAAKAPKEVKAAAGASAVPIAIQDGKGRVDLSRISRREGGVGDIVRLQEMPCSSVLDTVKDQRQEEARGSTRKRRAGMDNIHTMADIEGGADAVYSKEDISCSLVSEHGGGPGGQRSHPATRTPAIVSSVMPSSQQGAVPSSLIPDPQAAPNVNAGSSSQKFLSKGAQNVPVMGFGKTNGKNCTGKTEQKGSGQKPITSFFKGK